MHKIKDDIKNRKFEKVYLLFGEENYLKKNIINELKKALIPETAEIMNLDIFNEKKLESKKISDACETLPFMNDFRLVIVKDSELFIQGSKDESDAPAEAEDKPENNTENAPDSPETDENGTDNISSADEDNDAEIDATEALFGTDGNGKEDSDEPSDNYGYDDPGEE